MEASNDPKEIIPRAQRAIPHLVIVNSDLPDFDANEFCTEVKKQMNIPVLLIFDANSLGTIHLEGCSADEILIKPFAKELLIQTVEKLLHINVK